MKDSSILNSYEPPKSEKQKELEAVEQDEEPPATKNMCDMCDKSFYHRFRLIDHKILKHGDDSKKKLECNQCRKKFTSPSQLKYHQASHNNLKENPCVYCSSCSEPFKFASFYIKHLGME